VFESYVVHEWLEALQGFLKASKLASALVANNDGRYFVIDEPIDERKKRQAKTIRERDQQDTNKHDRAADQLVKVLHDIEPAAFTDNTVVKKVFMVAHLP